MDAKKLIVITGPAGSGKTSLRDYVIDKYHAAKVITHTTRAPRDGEQNGIDYYFENNESFNQLHLLEHVKYSHAKYGSSMEGINEAWTKNDLAIIVLDTLGAATYKEKLGDQAIVLFVQVNDPVILRERMIKRGDDIERVNQRISSNEYKRDIEIPDNLKDVATIIENNDWQKAQNQVDELIKTI